MRCFRANLTVFCVGDLASKESAEYQCGSATLKIDQSSSLRHVADFATVSEDVVAASDVCLLHLHKFQPLLHIVSACGWFRGALAAV
jgi:hypothetical protein